MVPGLVVSIGKGFGVATGEGLLEVLEVQMEGKQAAPAADFLRGQRALMGTRLPS
jgi:methionyl-tRNA formyltransferase